MSRSRQPRTIDELLDPQRVIVTLWGCWLWVGGDDGNSDAMGLGGYGRILRPGTRRVMQAHRYVYETFIGPIPAGYDVDHTCAKWSPNLLACRKCVNPEHLQAVPPMLNQQLKMLRRLGYGTEEMRFDCEDVTPAPRPQQPPLLAPGEALEDLEL